MKSPVATPQETVPLDIVRVRQWWAQAELHQWGGLHFQHAVVCSRRAWLHTHGVRSVNEKMKLASLAHEASYSRDASLVGLLGLAPDRVLWAQRVVEEHKHGKANHDCAKAQALFYAGAMTAATGYVWTARLVSLSTRQRHEWPFDAAALEWMEAISSSLTDLVVRGPPSAKRMSACSSCSFLSLCGWETA